MKKTFACAVRPNKAPSMCCGLSSIGLENTYGLYRSRIFDPHSWHQSAVLKSVFHGEVLGEDQLVPLGWPRLLGGSLVSSGHGGRPVVAAQVAGA